MIEGVEFVVFDGLNQHVGIALICGVATELKPLCPTSVIVIAKGKKSLVAFPLEE